MGEKAGKEAVQNKSDWLQKGGEIWRIVEGEEEIILVGQHLESLSVGFGTFLPQYQFPKRHNLCNIWKCTHLLTYTYVQGQAWVLFTGTLKAPNPKHMFSRLSHFLFAKKVFNFTRWMPLIVF